MPFSNLLRSAAGTCRHCRQKAGIIARAHRDCQETFQDGWTEMVAIAAEAAKPQSFRTGDGWFAYNLAVNLAQM